MSLLTWNIVIFMPGHSAASVILLQRGLATSAHGDLSSPLCSLDNRLWQCSARSTEQKWFTVASKPTHNNISDNHVWNCVIHARKQRLVSWHALQTWTQCFSLFALEGLAEVLFVLQQMQRSWRWTVGSGFSAGASWRSPPSLSSPPHQKPL